jgi:hypothetical protein
MHVKCLGGGYSRSELGRPKRRLQDCINSLKPGGYSVRLALTYCTVMAVLVGE